MDNTTPLRLRRALGALGLSLLGATALGACGGQDAEPASAQGGSGIDAQGAVDRAATGLPEECSEPFPVAVGEPALDDVTLMPATWPQPPVDAVLCQTSGTIDDNLQSADYATEATEAEVLDAYEAALSSYSPSREDQGAGEMIFGSIGDVAFQITTRPGAFSVLFGGQ